MNHTNHNYLINHNHIDFHTDQKIEVNEAVNTKIVKHDNYN